MDDHPLVASRKHLEIGCSVFVGQFSGYIPHLLYKLPNYVHVGMNTSAQFIHRKFVTKRTPKQIYKENRDLYKDVNFHQQENQ